MSHIHLNVGGVYFTTLRATLAQSDSFFAGLVASGQDEVFIDRDPTHFRHILNWLRGVRYLPDDENVLRELRYEAEYYALADMVALMRAPRTKRYSLPRSIDEIATLLRST